MVAVVGRPRHYHQIRSADRALPFWIDQNSRHQHEQHSHTHLRVFLYVDVFECCFMRHGSWLIIHPTLRQCVMACVYVQSELFGRSRLSTGFEIRFVGFMTLHDNFSPRSDDLHQFNHTLCVILHGTLDVTHEVRS